MTAVHSKLSTTQVLQTKFDAWSGNWFGGKRRAAIKEAEAEIVLRNREEYSQVKEVFQHEKYDAIGRQWKCGGLVLCTDTSVACSDLFDPATAEKTENSRWIIDFTLASIDADGWTYSTDFASLNRSGAGDSAAKWNSYVRRRKWRHLDGNVSSAGQLKE